MPSPSDRAKPRDEPPKRPPVARTKPLPAAARASPAKPGAAAANPGPAREPPVREPPLEPVVVHETPSPAQMWWEKARGGLKKFWTSRSPGTSLAKDLVVAAGVVFVLLAVVWGYTGQPVTQAPLVVIESGSMMHAATPYGRIGTIDPGDLVFVKEVHSRGAVNTFYGGGDKHYGNPGDVIVYKPGGSGSATPIIHRAMAYVIVTCQPSGVEARTEACQAGQSRTYTVREWGVEDEPSINKSEIGLINYQPTHSGFITKGDNPRTNQRADQATSISPEPVQVAWVIGKARGEVPWFGLIKLALYGNEGASPERDWCTILEATAPCDAWVMLGVSLGVLVAIPLGIDFVQYVRVRRELR